MKLSRVLQVFRTHANHDVGYHFAADKSVCPTGLGDSGKMGGF
jgi:hypothetical protein